MDVILLLRRDGTADEQQWQQNSYGAATKYILMFTRIRWPFLSWNIHTWWFALVLSIKISEANRAREAHMKLMKVEWNCNIGHKMNLNFCWKKYFPLSPGMKGMNDRWNLGLLFLWKLEFILLNISINKARLKLLITFCSIDAPSMYEEIFQMGFSYGENTFNVERQRSCDKVFTCRYEEKVSSLKGEATSPYEH